MVVIAIIAILMTLGIVGFSAVADSARMAGTVTNLRALANACINFSADNGGKLPSPEYPGDYTGPNYPVAGAVPSESKPAYWDLTESGLWLDGVIYARVYIEDDDSSREAQKLAEVAPDTAGASRATEGAHLVGTLFESTGSVKHYPSETNWYRHSFAMNANLQYDGLYSETGGGRDAWLTEKTLGNLLHQSSALLFVDCNQKNVVMAEDIELIRESAERYGGNKLVVCRVDGSTMIMKPKDIPEGDPFSDREASKFWRGVAAD